MESIWFLFWRCPLLSVDCFHKLCLSDTPSENSQAGWDLGNRMARGYRFDVKWVCPMGSYAWGIQVFCSRWWFEMRWCLISRTEHLNTSGITSHGTDSFRVKPITPGHPIPKISTHLTIFWGGIFLKDRVCENNPQTKGDVIRKEIRQIAQEMLNRVVNNFIVQVAAVLSYSSMVYGTNIVLIIETYSKSLLILEWLTPKEFYKLPVSVEKKSWSFPYFCKSYCQRKIGTFFWATL